MEAGNCTTLNMNVMHNYLLSHFLNSIEKFKSSFLHLNRDWNHRQCLDNIAVPNGTTCVYHPYFQIRYIYICRSSLFCILHSLFCVIIGQASWQLGKNWIIEESHIKDQFSILYLYCCFLVTEVQNWSFLLSWGLAENNAKCKTQNKLDQAFLNWLGSRNLLMSPTKDICLFR